MLIGHLKFIRVLLQNAIPEIDDFQTLHPVEGEVPTRVQGQVVVSLVVNFNTGDKAFLPPVGDFIIDVARALRFASRYQGQANREHAMPSGRVSTFLLPHPNSPYFWLFRVRRKLGGGFEDGGVAEAPFDPIFGAMERGDNPLRKAQ
jgi:hypothetical protein